MAKRQFIVWIEEIETEDKGCFGLILLTLLKWFLLFIAYVLYWFIGGPYILIKSIMYKNPLWIGLGIQYTLALVGCVIFSESESFWFSFFAIWFVLNAITLIVFNVKEDELDLS